MKLSGFDEWNATHLKTGNTYRVVGEAINCTNEQDGQMVVIYQREGRLFVRSMAEFQHKFSAAPCTPAA